MCGIFGYEGHGPKDLKDFQRYFNWIQYRGPDHTRVIVSDDFQVTLGFHRLSIMDTSSLGHQPFVDESSGQMLVCNGEIYNYQQLKKSLAPGILKSHSDCEVLLPLILRDGMKATCQSLDGEFALIFWDAKKKLLQAARDPIGIRPLFYGYEKNRKKILFASEAKVLHPFCSEIKPFPVGHYYDGQKFICYSALAQRQSVNTALYAQLPGFIDSKKYLTDEAKILKGIRELLIEGVEKRLQSDVPIGFLLSGGVDSSLVCGIAQHLLKKKITTFSVGLDVGPIDLKYAKIVADGIKSDHHEVIFTANQSIEVLDQLIFHLETWDVTTIRASIGMYFVCQYVKQQTPIKVLMTGEISDELFGYKYTDFAPNAQEFQLEAEKRLSELYAYDVLRADRCIAAHALEARVPFGDLAFVQHVMSINPELKLNKNGTGKYLLRKAFDDLKLIPAEILWREKAAFSDAVGHSMVDELKKYAEQQISDEEFKEAKHLYPHHPPYSKEALLYRHLFEKHFPGRAELIPGYWMPNATWPGCQVNDPSARVLSNYGKSGV